jgi:hypothetical protein
MTPRDDRASTLLLFPAALLVMVVLASVTIDFARLHLAQRQADDVAAAAANDAVTVGLDIDALRAGSTYRLSAERVDAVVADHARSLAGAGWEALVVEGHLRDQRSVQVEVQARVPLAFARALPGTPSSSAVHGGATATARLR